MKAGTTDLLPQINILITIASYQAKYEYGSYL